MADVYGDYGLMNLKHKKKGFNPFSKKNMRKAKTTLRKAGHTMQKVSSIGADLSTQLGAPPIVTTGFNTLGQVGKGTLDVSKKIPKQKL
jgi:hypothetical protein